MSDAKTVVTFDGACSGNPGPAAFAAVSSTGEVRRGFIGLATSNVAELCGLGAAVKLGIGSREPHVVIRGDSQLAIRAVRGEWNLSNPRLASVLADVLELLDSTDQAFEFVHVKRDHNTRADDEAGEALAEGMAKPSMLWPTRFVEDEPDAPQLDFDYAQ